MKALLLSALTSLAIVGSVLMTDSPAQAQRGRRGGYGVGVYVSPSRGVGVYYGPRYSNYGRPYDGSRYYYGNRYYDGRYRRDYYAPRNYDYYYTSNGWRICHDRYTGDYWYHDKGYWYRWY
jgi:hypothetical protein